MTTKDAIERSGIDATLVKAVIATVGMDALEDIRNHGADAGYSGITYYNDTVKFFRSNRAKIVKLAERMADDLGENVVLMIAGFNCLGGRGVVNDSTNEYTPSIARCLYGTMNDDNHTDRLVANALAWFACEEVARAFED